MDSLNKIRSDHEPTHTLFVQDDQDSDWSGRKLQGISLVDANICKLICSFKCLGKTHQHVFTKSNYGYLNSSIIIDMVTV